MLLQLSVQQSFHRLRFGADLHPNIKLSWQQQVLSCGDL